MRTFEWIQGRPLTAEEPKWALIYATEDAPIEQALRTFSVRYRGIPVFGATSFRGVFSPEGFVRGIHALVGEAADGIRAAPVMCATKPRRAREDAQKSAQEIVRMLGRTPNAILLHATPGFEERVLEGIDDAFRGSPPPVYGGSAADDQIAGKWKVFLGVRVESEGFVMVGFHSARPVHGSFVAGYSATSTRGKVTAAAGRIVHTIDGRPAAVVYNEWTRGIVEKDLSGGVVLGKTTLAPLGRLVDRVGNVPRYLLSHPHEIQPDGSMSFFTDMRVGDELVLMNGTVESLLERTSQAAARALGGTEPAVAGGILVYCGGCVGAIAGRTDEVSSTFSRRLGGAPFLGIATFGEQGCFHGTRSVNRHGNLMCDAILFE